MPDVLRVAVLGAGTVGREVVRAFLETPDRLVAAGASRLELVGVAVRDVDRAVASGIPSELVADDPAELVASRSADVVAELMGGEQPALALIAAALEAGRPVVTGNKHVLAHHGPALEAAATRSGAALRFEAAVGGGIPVLAPLAGDLAANRVSRVRGIVNGTTNVVLSAMAREGRTYADALAEAQSAGYAEADPTDDVEALDAANKLAILSRVAFGAWLDPGAIVRRPPTVDGEGPAGITGVTDREVEGASALGLVLKLVADAARDADGSVRASVVPTAVPVADPLARTNGATNRIEARADPVGSVAFSGPGAGGSATASAVLGDLLAIARGEGSTWTGRALGASSAEAPWRPADGGRGRGWFFVLPGEVSPAVLVAAFGPAVACRQVAAGTAVHVRSGSLPEVRAAVRTIVDLDLTIYPADERAG